MVQEVNDSEAARAAPRKARKQQKGDSGFANPTTSEPNSGEIVGLKLSNASVAMENEEMKEENK